MLAPFHPPTDASFPIVAVGASAGGLDAFTQLLQHLPADTGLALVLIQHLDRVHASFLSEALAKATTMPVRQAEHGTRVEPNNVYVIPPNGDLAIKAGQLVLTPRSTDESKPHLPVDAFMTSLALELGGHRTVQQQKGTQDGSNRDQPTQARESPHTLFRPFRKAILQR